MPVSSECEAVLAALGIGLLLLDDSSVVVAATAACGKLTGSEKEPLIGLGLSEALGRLGARCAELSALPQGVSSWPERMQASASICSEGRPPRGIGLVAARLEQAGATWGLVAFAIPQQDVVAPRHVPSEPQSANGRDRFHTLFEATGECVLIHEPRGLFIEANRAACDLLGYSRQELLSLGPDSIYEHAPPALTPDGKGPAVLCEPALLEAICIRKDGSTLPVELVCHRVVYNGRDAVLSLVRDLSASRRLDDALGEPRFLLGLVDALPIAVSLKRAGDGTYALWNRGAEKLSGLDREQVLGRAAEALLPAAEARAARATDLAALLTGEPVYSADGPFPLTSSEPTTALRSTTVPLYDDAGRPMAVLGVTEGITVQDDAVRQVRLNLQRHRDVYEAIPGGVLLVEAGGRISRANQAAREVLGISDLDGQHTFAETCQACDENGRPLGPDELPWERVLATGQPAREALVGVSDSLGGATRWLLVNAQPLRQGDATASPAAVVTFVDITAQRQAEADLRRSHALLRRVLSSLDAAVLVIDPDGCTVEDCNTPAQDLFGYSPQELRGMPVARLCADSGDGAGDAPACGDEGAEPAAARERFMVRKDGGQFMAECVTSPIAGEDGHPRRLVTVVRDITERRRRENALRLSAIGQLSAGVAHEFNNILASMMVSAERADHKRNQDEYDRLVSIVLAGSKRGAEIARRLGTLAHPRDIKPEPAVMEDIIESALSLLATQIGTAHVTVRREYSAGPARVCVDAAQMEQALVAVLANAVQAADGGGQVQVTTAWSPESGNARPVTITVRDNGPGIAPEHLPRVFEPFFTTKGLLSGSAVPGMGLGLCVAHGIVQAHRGTISVHSAPGTGTEVVISLPACDSERQDAAPVVAAVERECTGGGRILLVEDEPDIRQLVRESLRDAGYEVVSAASAGTASEVLPDGEFDLVITDIMMPDGGGPEVMQVAARCAEPPPIILITGRTEQAVIAELMAAGARMCLAKPFGIQELLDAVRRTIGPPPSV